MFEIMQRPEGRTAVHENAQTARGTDDARDHLVLHMRENRSHLSQHARETFTVLILLFMAVTILPALQGRLLVPLFALGTMAMLVLALEWHQRRPPGEEWLEIGEGQWRYNGRSGETFDLPTYWLRFEFEKRTPADCRLVFHNRTQRLEVGRCLNLAERREVAPILAHALAASNKR